MVSIPVISEKDLSNTLEGEFSLNIRLKNPNGTVYLTANDGAALKGFVRRSYSDSRELRGGSNKTIVNAPCVKLRISSLPEIPATGEYWLVGIPESSISNEVEWFNLDPKKAVEVNKNTGTVKMFLVKMQGGTA